MSRTYLLPIAIELLADGTGYLATCEALQGCHAEGGSIVEALDNVEDVARNLLELRLQDGLDVPAELREEKDAAPHMYAQILVSLA